MSHFFRLLNENDKAQALHSASQRLRKGERDIRHFEVSPDSFGAIPGEPFAYWVSDNVRNLFKTKNVSEYSFKQGIATADDFRFLKSWWEVFLHGDRYLPIAKGGPYSPWYQDLDLVVEWNNDGEQIRSFPKSRPQNIQYFRKPGITWPFRTQKGLNTRVLPAGSAFTIQGMGAFHELASPQETLLLLGLTNSTPFKQLLLISVGFFAFQTGAMASVPIPSITEIQREQLISLAARSWKLRRIIDSMDETSHAFLLPKYLARRSGVPEVNELISELDTIQANVNDLVFSLYGLTDSDKTELLNYKAALEEASDSEGEDLDSADVVDLADDGDFITSWAVGVVFGRFDWRLATSERAAPAEPEPFDPLPVKSPGMLPDGAESFHANEGILVDDPGHPHDLARLVEEVLARVEAPVPEDVRRWLQRDFFAFHLQRYSKSRRKAPIYWPMSTTSGSYTLWVYYSSLTSQTLYTAINDFVDPNLKQVGAAVTALRNKGAARTRDDEKQFEALQAFELELSELRDTLLKLAPTYKPNHDDGVQINAAPLWSLFRHKPWQKVLKDTWANLEKGDYDWTHLAMNYWPERVREKCKTDKSLAIAHGLEELYEEPEAKPKKTRKKKAGGDE